MMNEEEAKKALFQLHYEYMQHTQKERLKLYEEYQRNRTKIKNELMKGILEKKVENKSL